MDDLVQALSVAIETAREAGAMLRKEYYRPGGPRGSDEHADIDREVEEVIQQRLLAAFPWNYLGEELRRRDTCDGPFRWLVDPNDGTKLYLRGWRGSAVSIAALKDGVPVLGVVYAFCYPDDEGDLIAWAEGSPMTRNGQPLAARLSEGRLEVSANPPPFVFVSQDADKNPPANAACVHPARYIAMPSIAYRLARVAAGDGIAAVSLNSPCSWDYAAGHALLRGAGGVLIDESGEEVRYSTKGDSSVQWCFGGSCDAVRELCQRNWHSVFFPSGKASPPFSLVRPERGRAINDTRRLTRAQGCLLGQLAGDALGGLVEFKSRPSIRAAYPNGVRDLIDGGVWKNLAGQPTDDSELALMLARTLGHLGRYDPGAMLDSYVHWLTSHPFDLGNTIGQALDAASRGNSTAERLRQVQRHANQASESNGSLMRISPLGIFGVGRPAQAAEWAREDSRLTHPNPVCQDACAVFVYAIATAIGKCLGPRECHEAAFQAAKHLNVQASVRQALEDSRQAAPLDYVKQMGWVLIALQNAFYQLLHAPSLEEGVIDTVMRGGDTDTNGAIAGALLGAVHGQRAIPTRWLYRLLSCRPLPQSKTIHPRPCEFWPVDVLFLAESLLSRAQNS
jgi:ADP-ribosyl-[dinitrogen reductase] hydrolase